MNNQYLTIWDLVLTPVFLLLLSYVAMRQRDRNYTKKHPLYRYYMPGLYIKFGGTIFIALIYQYYYGTGDTYYYFEHAKTINSSLEDGIGTWVKLLFRVSADEDPNLYKYIIQLPWYRDPSSYTVASIAAILGLFTGTTYLPTALLFAFFSFSGIWAMFRTFANIYPKLHREIAIAFLFIPSTFVWGSAIFKDTVCMFGLGWMVYTTFRIFVNRDFSVANMLMLIFSFYIIAIVKLYILLAFLPALSLWLLMTYSHKIKSVGLRWIVNLMFLGVTVMGFLFLSEKFAQEMNKYSLEKIAATAQSTRSWINYASGDEGSAYDLGEFDPGVAGMLTKFPQAVVVTLYRPFIWESRKLIVALSAIEALVFLFYTLKVIFTRRAALKNMMKDQNLLFCLIYSLIFAFAVGISSYNFGALSRYKIPCLPFYATVLVVLLYKDNKRTPVTAPQKQAKLATTV